MATTWFIRAGGKVHGPFDSSTLRKLAADRKVTPVMEVSKAAEGPWTRAGSVAGLFPAKPTQPSPPAIHARSSAAPPALPTAPPVAPLGGSNVPNPEVAPTTTTHADESPVVTRLRLCGGIAAFATGFCGLILVGDGLCPSLIVFAAASVVANIADSVFVYLAWNALPITARPFKIKSVWYPLLTYIPGLGYVWYWIAYACLGRALTKIKPIGTSEASEWQGSNTVDVCGYLVAGILSFQWFMLQIGVAGEIVGIDVDSWWTAPLMGPLDPNRLFKNDGGASQLLRQYSLAHLSGFLLAVVLYVFYTSIADLISSKTKQP